MNWTLITKEPEGVNIEKAKAILRQMTKDAKFREEHDVGEDITTRLPAVHFAYDTQHVHFRNFLPDTHLWLENRVHRIMAFDLLSPLHIVTNVKDFMKAFRDIFQGK